MDVDPVPTNGHQLVNGPIVLAPSSKSASFIAPPLEEMHVAAVRQDYSNELPLVTEGLVSLRLIVDRVIGQAHSDLANLAEILPSKSDDERKRAIVDYVLQTRRQILKLLVLVRWSKEADSVSKCMNIIGFLARQNYQFDHAVHSLTEVKTMLAGARVRNCDIPTAVTVLTTGAYSGLPACIAEAYLGTAPLDDDAVVRTLEEMDEVLRYRLALVERLPRRMRRYRIANGRVTFRIDGMWEADMTYGGDNEDVAAEWYLLSVKFLFRVMDARGTWSSIPLGPMKEHIVELCNRELAKRPATVADHSTGAVQALTIDDSPLVRGYNFLQTLTLSYQIEALYLQAAQLANTSWSGNLRVDLSKNRKTLRLEYWIESRTSPTISSTSSAAPRPLPPSVSSPLSVISISFDPAEAILLQSTSTSSRSRALELALDSRHPVSAARGDEVVDSLTISWTSDEVSDDVRSRTKLELTPDLSLESLLLHVTQVHAKHNTVLLYEALVTDGSGLDAADIAFVDVGGLDPVKVTSTTSILAQLHTHQSVRVLIDQYSGRLNYKSIGEASAVREARLRTASEKANENRKLAAESLLRIRAAIIIDEIESRAVYLSLTTSRRLSLRDLSKFGAAARGYLFVHLSKHKMSMHYLVLLMLEDGFRFALMEVKSEKDATQSWLKVEELGWLNKTKLDQGRSRWELTEGQSKLHSFDVSLEDLRDLYQYCVNRIASFKIEQQLHLLRIPSKTIAPSSPADSLPYLAVKSSDLLRSTAKVAYPNIAIRSLLQNDVVRTVFHVRFIDLHLLKPTLSRLPPNMSYHAKSSSITFSSEDIDFCVTTFLAAYSKVARAIVTARHNYRLGSAKAEGNLNVNGIGKGKEDDIQMAV